MRAKPFFRTFEFALLILTLLPCAFPVMARTARPRAAAKTRAASRTTQAAKTTHATSATQATHATKTAEVAEPPAASSSGPSTTTAANTAAATSTTIPVVNSTPTSATVGGGDIASCYGKKFVNGPSSTKKIAITFDDGPSAKLTPQVLEILKRERIKATFFMLGGEVRQSPELAKRVAAEGHEIGCHTNTHCNLRTKSPAVIQKEVVGAAESIAQITGRKPHVFRPPYGEYNKSVEKSCAEGEMVMVLWSVDTNDWRRKTTPERIYTTCLRETQGGSVILMHDIHEKGIQALPRVIEDLKAKGFQFVTVSDLVAESLRHPATPAAGAAAKRHGTDEDAPAKAKPVRKSHTRSGRK